MKLVAGAAEPQQMAADLLARRVVDKLAALRSGGANLELLLLKTELANVRPGKEGDARFEGGDGRLRKL